MKDQGPTNKFDIIELLKKTFPKYKITLSNFDFATTPYDMELMKDASYYTPRSYDIGKSITTILQTIYIAKNFFMRASVTIRFVYSQDTIMTDNFKWKKNIMIGNMGQINTKDIDQETWEKMYSSYNTKRILVSSVYPQNLDFLKNLISSNLKNEIEKVLKLKYGESMVRSL